MNADQSEINKFSIISDQWWHEHGEFSLLHKINPIRMEFIEECARDLEGLKVIDVGCGGGILAEGLGKKGSVVTGLDLDSFSLDVARTHMLKSNLSIRYVKDYVENFSNNESSSFDLVTCMEMLEHVPDAESVIKSCAELCKGGGWVFFSTLNRNLKSFIASILVAEYLAKLICVGTHNYNRYIKPMELINTAQNYGLKAKKLKGINYNPITRKFFLSHNVCINYIIAFIKVV